MIEEFAPYELAVKLEALGFDKPCFGQWLEKAEIEGGGIILEMWNDEDTYFEVKSSTKAPTFSQAFSWFRKEHTMRHNIMDFIDDETGVEWDYEIATIGVDLDENGKYQALVEYSIDDNTRKFKTYEEAQTACLTNLIQIVETKSDASVEVG